MSERPKEHASKACEGNPLRGFKSHRHRTIDGGVPYGTPPSPSSGQNVRPDGRHGRMVPRMYALRGLRQAVMWIAGAAAVAVAVAVLAMVVWDGDLRAIFGITLMVIAALLAVTGGNAFSRATGADGRALAGLAPENDAPWSGDALAPVGVFLFVCVPLFVIGGLAYGVG